MSLPGWSRIIGVETEFGCYVDPEFGRPEQAVAEITHAVFDELRLGVIDRHARDEVFEPAYSGGFLLNGGRLYIDAVGSHLEYATAECRTLADCVAHNKAGQIIINRAIEKAGLRDIVAIYNNSIDHYGGHTFGCHENYLMPMDEEFFHKMAPLLMSFLVTRQIYAGVGRVGGHLLVEGDLPSQQEMMENPVDYIWVNRVYDVIDDDTVGFQLSQRADHIIRTIASRVRFNRAMINPKWEHYYATEGQHRLHMLFGEANQSSYAHALKVGTTHLVLRLLSDGLLDQMTRLASPLLSLREISRDESYRWRTFDADGDRVFALDIQMQHRELAERYRGEDSDTDWVLDEWATVLDALRTDPMSLGDRLDWVAKKQMIEKFKADAGTEATPEMLHTLDLEYHNINPEESLFAALPMKEFGSRIEAIDAVTDPPENTRAFGRSRIIEQVLRTGQPAAYMIDWSGAALGRQRYVDLSDPFQSYADV